MMRYIFFSICVLCCGSFLFAQPCPEAYLNTKFPSDTLGFGACGICKTCNDHTPSADYPYCETHEAEMVKAGIVCELCHGEREENHRLPKVLRMVEFLREAQEQMVSYFLGLYPNTDFTDDRRRIRELTCLCDELQRRAQLRADVSLSGQDLDQILQDHADADRPLKREKLDLSEAEQPVGEMLIQPTQNVRGFGVGSP